MYLMTRKNAGSREHRGRLVATSARKESKWGRKKGESLGERALEALEGTQRTYMNTHLYVPIARS